MTLPRRWSLDTPLADNAIVAGHNFREVAPEILSPLSWSLVGAGMERGFRQLGDRFGLATSVPTPKYVAYVGFRPYHVMSELEQILARVPGIESSDCWDLLLGGRPATLTKPSYAERSWFRGVWRELSLLNETDRQFAACSKKISAAEVTVHGLIDNQNPWAVGIAAQRAGHAAIEGWALHTVTTSSLLAAASFFGRALARTYSPELTTDLLKNLLRRPAVAGAGLPPVPHLPRDPLRVLRYEVADGGRLFGGSVPPPSFSPSQRAVAASEDLLPRGRFGERALRKLLGVVQTLVSEREASKLLALRGLHCVRRLIESACVDMPVDELAMLSIGEILGTPLAERQMRAEKRTTELEAARKVELPVDFEVRRHGIRELERRRPMLISCADGTALAPGWASGPLARQASDSVGAVLVGRQVEASDVLTSAPIAVVTEYGSMLSHVAIVCRELGIPMVTGISTDNVLDGRNVTVDGSTGRVSVDTSDRNWQ